MTKVKLKKIKFIESMSEETNCFQANVYFNNKLIAYAENRGNGGPTDVVRANGVMVDDFKLFNDYCTSLPPIKYHESEFPSDSEMVVDGLFEDWLKVKTEKDYLKKLEKNSINGICYKDIDGYSIISWKNHSIKSLLSTAIGRTTLENRIKSLKETGKVILNTNIPMELM